MSAPIVAIDFGTSFTAAAIRRDESMRLVDFGSGARFPSGVIWNEPESKLSAGQSAYTGRKRAPWLFVRTPKRLIDQPDYLLGSRLVAVPDMIEAVLEHALREVQRIVDQPSELRLTHPAVWSDTKKALLLDAGRHALAELGWRDVAVQSLPEPVAAAVEAANEKSVAAGSVLAVYDLGGGTFDAALVRRTRAGFEVVGSPKGLDLCGGEDFDEQIFDLIERSVEDRSEPSAQLFTPPDDESADARRTRLAFNLSLRDEIVTAKEALSESMQADVFVPSPMQLEATVTRSQFEGLIEAEVTRTLQTLQDTVQGAVDGKLLDTAELVGIVLTGGSSRIPLVERVVKDRFGLQIFTQPDRKGTVALGAVRWAPGERIATPSPGAEKRTEPSTFTLQPPVEFRSRLGVRVDSTWRHREIRIVVGNENLVINGYPSSLKDNSQWATSVRKAAAPDMAVGRVLPARVAGVEEGLQLWRLQTHDDGSATKYLERFALQRVNGGVRAAHIVAREGSDALVNHVRIGDPLLSSTEYEHTPFVVRVPAGTQAWERTTIIPRRKLGRAQFTVAAESTDLAPGVTADEWDTRVLARFSPRDLGSVAHEQDSFLGGQPAIRTIVKLQAPVGPARTIWACWWTGIVDGRGVAIAVEGPSAVSLGKAARYRDLFVLGTHD